jgi:hypothetical protein
MESEAANDVDFIKQYIAEYKRKTMSMIEGPLNCSRFTIQFSADYQELNGGTSWFETVCDVVNGLFIRARQDTHPKADRGFDALTIVLCVIGALIITAAIGIVIFRSVQRF